MSLTSDPAFRDAVAALVDHYASDIRARATVDNADALDQAGHVTAATFLRDTLEERASLTVDDTTGEATADGAPGRFRKKPVEIQAVRFVEESGDPDEIAAWCGGRVDNNLGHPSGKVAVQIPTLEGVMTAQYGDWIIRGVKGEFYPCKPDIFEATYDAVQAQREVVSE